MWRDTPSSMEMHDKFPELALRLETEYLINDLQQLGIKHTYRIRRKSVTIEVSMHPQHLLRITPTDKGSDGFSEWMTWHWSHVEDYEKPPQLNYSVRAHVEVFDLHNGNLDYNASFTIHEDDIEGLIRIAIKAMHQITGIRIKPVVKSRNSK